MNFFLVWYKLSDRIPSFFRRIMFLLFSSILPKTKIEEKDALNYLCSLKPDFGESSLKDNVLIEPPEYDLLVVVPIYNVEKYLEECLDSVFNQKTKYKFYVVAVNDGSTDNSEKILQRYRAFSNIKIIHQQNKGLSGARNAGMNEINAKYIMFVDSDDVLYDGCIDALLDSALQTNADVIQGSYSYYYNGRVIREERPVDVGFCNPQKCFGFAWGKLYKSSLFKRFHFPEKYLFEDTICRLILFNIAKTAYAVETKVVMYRRNMNGITATSKKNYKTIDTIWCTKKLIEDYKRLGLPITESVCNSFLKQFAFNYSRLLFFNDKKVNYAAFLLYRKIFENINIDMSHSEYGKKIAYESLKDGNYKKFFLSAIFLR